MRLETSSRDFLRNANPTTERGVEKTQTLEQDHTRYHRAAIDGYVDMLCEVSKKDANLPSKSNELTPTLLAAYHGHLEALRMLVGRGGDPEKGAADGSSALHLAASRNHLNCVSFLVNFGVNMWALDNELQTAKDVAAMLQRKEVLDFLDQMMAKQSALNTKNVQKLKEKAKLAAEKRLKKLRKAQLRAIKLVEKDERYLAKLSNGRRLLKSAHSISDIKLVEKSSTPSVSSCQLLQLLPAGIEQKKDQPDNSLTSAYLPTSTASRLSNSSSLTNMIRSNLLSRAKQLELRKQVPMQHHNLQPNNINKCPTSCSQSSISLSSCNLSSTSSSSTCQSKIDSDKLFNRSRDRNGVQKRHEQAKPSTKINGVSRKHHLKRKNLAEAKSCDTSHLEKQSSKTVTNEKMKEVLCTGAISDEQSLMTTKSKVTSSNQFIKWPPAPILNRAISEPDFGSALRTSEDEMDLDEQEVRSDADEENVDQNRQLAGTTDSNPTTVGRSVAFLDQIVQRDSCQHQLLTQCLSQLKLHQKAINKQHQQEQFVVYNENTPLLTENKANPELKANPSGNRQQSVTGGHSDELLQLRQLNQGRQPLKPSVIKQNQQLHYPPPQFSIANNNNNSLPQTTVTKSATISIDSIGSAGSFAHRNARSCQSSSSTSSSSSHTYCKSSKTSSDLTSSICSSTCASSIEIPEVANKNLKQQPLLEVNNQLSDTIETFLISNGLEDLGEVFASEKIDLEALVLLSEADLKSLNILLGPRRKLLKAIENLKSCTHQLPMYLMMDTQL